MNSQDGQQMQVNPQHIINSLRNQISDNSGNTAFQIAELNAVIASLTEQLEEYHKKEIAEMDAVAE